MLRFWSKVRIGGPGCWEWTASLQGGGYGQFWLDGSNALAHRVSYQTTVGAVPAGLQLDHLCRNRKCVRPDHLEPVTPSENTHRGDTHAARNAAKTHCPAGHSYTEHGRQRPDGRRECVTCKRERNRIWMRANYRAVGA